MMILEKESLINLICRRCDFDKDSDKALECSAFKILKGLLRKGVIAPAQIENAVEE